MENITQGERDTGVSTGYRIFSVVRLICVYLLALVIIVSAAFFAASKRSDKSLFGFRYYTVLTDSMVPEFRSGDMVFVKLANADQIEAGDIITFNPSSGGTAYLTHRVTDKLTNYQGTGVTCFRTKGDANNSDDSFLIDESRVIGKVKFHIPRLGYIIRFVQLKWYFVLPVIGLAILFFVLMKRYFDMKTESVPESEEAAPQQQEI